MTRRDFRVEFDHDPPVDGIDVERVLRIDLAPIARVRRLGGRRVKHASEAQREHRRSQKLSKAQHYDTPNFAFSRPSTSLGTKCATLPCSRAISFTNRLAIAWCVGSAMRKTVSI